VGAGDAEPRERAIRAASTVFGGFLLLAVVDACAIAALVPMPVRAAGGLALRVAHHVYDAAETLGVGAILALAVGVFVRAVPLGRRASVGVPLGVAAAVVYLVLGDYLGIFSEHLLDGRLAAAIFVVWMTAIALGLTAAPLVAARARGRPFVRFLPLSIAVGVLVVDQLALRDDYMDVHGVLALGAVLFGGAALAPRVERAAMSLGRTLAGRLALAALGLLALFGLVHPPPNAARFELFRQPCAVAPWILATLEWRAPTLHAPVKLPESPWLRDRSGAPDVAPTAPPLLPSDAVVVLITLDALRAEVVANPDNDARFPTLAKLRREGVFFTHAYTPGAQTEVSMAALFSGRYYSELLWTDYGSGWAFHPHPVEDPSVRFPELLESHGVATANFAGISFLGEGYGVTRGFREDTKILFRKTSAPGFRLIGAMMDRLKHPGEGPMFLVAHLIDTHAPYGRGRKEDSDYERYLTTIPVSDKQLGRVLSILEATFGQRWALFVSADHGEAFGEHQSHEHGKTLYEELLHVPRLARSSGPRSSISSAWRRRPRSRVRASFLCSQVRPSRSRGRSSPRAASGGCSGSRTGSR
jgi:Sulfatase